VSRSRDDNIIPLIYILQKGSPQIEERSDNYVKGAKPGEFWIRGTDNIFSGTTGILVQPCAFLKCWIEWGPRRGDGFKGRHNFRPDDAREKQIKDEQGRPRIVWARPNGNIVVETREHYVLIDDDAFVIPFVSTGHTVSRTWMALMNQFRDSSGNPYDSFSRMYHLTTIRKEKDGNSWYMIKAADGGWVPTENQFDRGLSLHQAVMSGEKVADQPSEEAPLDESETSPRTSDEDAASAGI
jgi:hypothetical protein